MRISPYLSLRKTTKRKLGIHNGRAVLRVPLIAPLGVLGRRWQRAHADGSGSAPSSQRIADVIIKKLKEIFHMPQVIATDDCRETIANLPTELVSHLPNGQIHCAQESG